jgi:putative sterol carrier protein
LLVPRFPSDAWVQAFVQEINASGEYLEAAEDWEGDIAFVILPEPDKGQATESWVWLDLWRGRCRAGGMVTPERGREARYVITAPYTRWKDVLMGELDPIKGMMQGKLRVQGDLPTIIRYVRAANELVRLTGEVDTVFPDEV